MASNKMISPGRTNLSLVLIVITLSQLIRLEVSEQQLIIESPLSGIDAAAPAVGGGGQQPMPGHYEFEVAPRMEPPSVRRPPYQQSSTQTCPGSDPFAGLSARDTLCGNLNEGRIPLNPIGQNINDQSYPFELIKNKTLQFLARALPVLKLEYETIPKVARYLPSQQLLNPTHMGSPLGQAHFQRLNQAIGGANSPLADESQTLNGMRRRRRRRRKRSHSAQASLTVSADGERQQPAGATLLVSSAHSSASSGLGRIHSLGERSPEALALITKNGYKSLLAGGAESQSAAAAAAAAASRQAGLFAATANSSLETQPPPPPPPFKTNSSQSSGENKAAYRAADQSQQQQQQQQQSQHQQQQQSQRATGNTASQQPIGANPQQQPQQQQLQLQRNHAKATTADSGQGALQARSAPAAAATAAATGTPPERPPKQQQQEQPELTENKEQPSSGLSKRRSLKSCSDSANGFTSVICQAAASLIEGTERQQQLQQQQPLWMQALKHLGAALAGGSEALAPPAAAATPVQSNPLWTILGALSGLAGPASGQEAQSKSSQSSKELQAASNQKANLVSLIAPIASLLVGNSNAKQQQQDRAKESAAAAAAEQDSGGSAGNKAAAAAAAGADVSFASSLANNFGGSTLAKLALAGWASNAVSGLIDYFAPSFFSSASRSFARRKKPYDLFEQYVDTPASLAAAAASSGQSRQLQPGFSAAAAALTSQQQQQQQPQLGQQQGAAQQPAKQQQLPTPCPSVEEYISPTFARNYQGTWKYVIQIPHEGYFTQTIQRTSCLRQRCEFTDGVCHESPRWVSLLVAEIYYPHAVFQQPAQVATLATSQQQQQQLPPQQQQHQQQQQQQLGHNQMAASPSISSIQQVQPAAMQQQQQQQPMGQTQRGQRPLAAGQVADPLQMTDSLNAYNHNLNSAFIEAANELGMDPSNPASMQQLADAFNYQLMQRHGLLGAGGQSIESRSGGGGGAQQLQSPFGPAPNQAHFAIQPPANQPQQQQQPQPQQLAYSSSANDYILSLAAATLKQNPNMSLNELMASLQASVASQSRMKRDLGRPTAASMRQQQQQQPAVRIQQRSGSNAGAATLDQQSASANPALNEISSSHPAVQQQQQFNGQDSHQPDSSSASSSSSSSSAAAAATAGQTSGQVDDQTECDGHDKIGCYVVRVYYDWFLVNGSCKCWKTTGANSAQQSSSSMGQSGNSFLRRIFTG